MLLLVVGFLVASFTCTSVGLPQYNEGTIDWKVIGGSRAPIGAYPFIISLKVLGSHFCGGSLIKNNWVLTAAHCVSGRDPATLTVVAGTNSLISGGISVEVEKITVHSDYDPVFTVNDVAVIKLKTPLISHPLIQPIDISCISSDTAQNCMLAGWGSYFLGGPTSVNLLQLRERTITFKDCQERMGIVNKVVESQICTYTRNGEGACHGDSGGPLFTVDEERKPTLIGLVSWGRPCALGFPDVYTRVSAFCEWIKENSK